MAKVKLETALERLQRRVRALERAVEELKEAKHGEQAESREGHGGVQAGDAALGVGEGTEGDVPQAGGGDRTV